MKLLRGDRHNWLRFVCKIAEDLEGTTDPLMREFCEEYHNLSNVNGPSGQHFIPDQDFVKSCSEMVASGFIENQLLGLQGLIEAGKHCAPNDMMSKELVGPIADALDETSGKVMKKIVE